MSISVGIDDIVKRYGDMATIPDLSVFIKNGGFFALLGPFGCGKATLLRMVAGFSSIEGGSIEFGGEVINDTPAQGRSISMVFQSYAIFLHLAARRNTEYDLKTRKVPKKHIKGRVDEILKAVKIGEYQDRPPERLSGGQQQRVALTRVIVIHPQVLLMDRPLSNLGVKLYIEMRSATRDVQKRVGITIVYVTHNREETPAISDRVAVMRLGMIQQTGNSRDIYTRPCNAFVSTFIDHPDLSFGTTRKQEGMPSVVFEDGYHVKISNLVDTAAEGQRVMIFIRSEKFLLNQEGMDCEIISRVFLGKYTNYFLHSGKGMILGDQPSIEYSQDLGHADHIFTAKGKIRPKPNLDKINVFIQDIGQSLIEDVKKYDE